MALICRFYIGDALTEHELKTGITSFSIGGKGDTLVPEGLELKKKHLQFIQATGGWSFRAITPVLQRGAQKTEGTLAPGEFLVLDQVQKAAMVVFERSPNSTRTVDISAQSRILIGRSDMCDIVVTDKIISGKHLELRKNASGWLAHDCGGANGTYLNGRRITDKQLFPGDMLDLGLCRIIFTGNSLSIAHTGTVKMNFTAAAPIMHTAQKPEDAYPHLFKRSPRLMEDIPVYKMDFQSAPGIGGKPQINWLTVLLPPIASVCIMLAISFLLGGAVTMLFFSVPMSILGVIMSIIGYRSQCKKYHQTEQLRLDKYNEYLDEKEKEIREKQNGQWRILSTIHPPTADCAAIAAEPARRLWERRPSDHDFMELRVGEGEADSCVEFQLPRIPLTLEEDALANRPHQLAEQYKKVAHCPITYSSVRFPSCGIIGERRACITLAKNLILQAVTHHSYEDLRLVLVFDKDERAEWEFARWLPHIFNDTRSERYIADNLTSAKRVFSSLGEILSSRAQGEDRCRRRMGVPTPYYLVICASGALMERQPIMDYLTANNPELGVGTLFLFDEMDMLPKESSIIIEAKGRKGILYQRDHTAERTDFSIDAVKSGSYEEFARSLAPIRIEASGGRESMPTSVSFLQGYQAKRPHELTQPEKWPEVQPEKSMSVPIGVRASGDPFFFDIHEKAHGPHGLVAGMTGSGKSEMVQSWILSMALRFPPEAVSFVLIDFKGTGLILPFRGLPHLAGTISDLDVNITRNLIALENELNRRKALLDEFGVSNISGYLRLYRSGKASTPLSYLFIVIDEFAEFKVQFPDFMQVINRVFAIGRTLGVHILLLTQKPTSVVDEKMSANTRFRWCLKVASSADSKEMLGHTDAARITNPGRAFVQVGEDEIFEEVQSYWSGAPYTPQRDLALQRNVKVSVVDLYGRRTSYEPEKTTGFRSDKNEIDAVVEYLDNFTRKNEIPRARNIWTSKMAAEIQLGDLLQIAFDGENWNESDPSLAPVVGLIDDPRSQSQYPLKLNLSEEGHAILYGAPGTGKTIFLHSLIMSLALSYSPAQVSLYLLDFGGGSLALFRKLPHVGEIARDSEEEKVEKICGMLQQELNRRKELFAEQGVVSIHSYREVSGDPLPYVVLALDNFAPVLNLFPELNDFFQSLSREGGNYGMYFITTANNQNAVSFRVAQNVRLTLTLRMTDKNDYSAIVGRTNGMEPENLPGRGLVKGNPPLEFQTALPAVGDSESQRVSNIRQLVELMNQKWNGHRPEGIRRMPDRVSAADYPIKSLFMGLASDSFQPVAMNFATEQFLLLSSLPDSERDTRSVMQALIRQLPKALSSGEMTLYDTDGALSEMKSLAKGYITDSTAFDQYIAGLMPELQKRKDLCQSDGAQALEGFAPIVIVIRDLGACFTGASEETVKRLYSIVNLGSGLKVYLLVCGKNADITRLYHGGDYFTMALADKCAALLIGGCFQTHGVFKSQMGYTDAVTTVGPMEGYLVQDGNAKRLRLLDA